MWFWSDFGEFGDFCTSKLFGGLEARAYSEAAKNIFENGLGAEGAGDTKNAEYSLVQKVKRLEVEPHSAQFVEFPIPVVGTLLKAVLPAGDAWAASYVVNLLQASVRFREMELRPTGLVLRGHPLF